MSIGGVKVDSQDFNLNAWKEWVVVNCSGESCRILLTFRLKNNVPKFLCLSQVKLFDNIVLLIQTEGEEKISSLYSDVSHTSHQITAELKLEAKNGSQG